MSSAQEARETQRLYRRVQDLRFGLKRVIEKAKYDEYGGFEQVRERIIALCVEILDDDVKEANR